MKSKNSGFSLIELLAVLLITTILIVPLLSTLIGNVQMNSRAKLRRNAISIVEGTLYGLQKIDFSLFRSDIDAVETSDLYIEYNADSCSSFSLAKNEDLCDQIFGAIWGNSTYDVNEFKVYMFNYSLTSAQWSQLVNDNDIEESARNVIEFNEDILKQKDGADAPDLIRIIVWIDYNDEPDLYVSVAGLIYND